MLTQTLIQNTINNAKSYNTTLLNTILVQESYGEDCTEMKGKFNLLNHWIEILQDYLDNNFDANGVLTPAIFVCLTADEIAELVAKVNLVIGCASQSSASGSGSDWILATGSWRDSGFWRDTATWID